MLENADLESRLSKPEYKSQMDVLEKELGILQRQAQQEGRPIAIVFEGWDAAGKGSCISRLIQALDPRGYQVYPTSAPTQEEALRPFLWRFWKNTPAKGRISIFDRSWYGKVLFERVNKLIPDKEWKNAYARITDFEQALAADGTILIKLFLHISQEQQKKRFEKIKKNKAEAWKVSPSDWKQYKHYQDYWYAVEDMYHATHQPDAPWFLIETEQLRYGILKMYKTVINAIRHGLSHKPRRVSTGYKACKKSLLDQADLSLELSREDYKEELKKYQKRFRELEYIIYTRRIPVIIAYEGWDAAGKGGNIRRLISGLDPRGFDVVPIAAPTPRELAHHYQWRFWKELPKAGHIAIFDRTWYGRVLVERIEGFAGETEWKRAYAEINAMEKAWTQSGAVLVKLWLHISPEEQLRRFEERKNTPEKNWKITDEDWRNREKWDVYHQAVDDMLSLCSPPEAPWTIIEANSKYFARIRVLKTVCEAIEKVLK